MAGEALDHGFWARVEVELGQEREEDRRVQTDEEREMPVQGEQRREISVRKSQFGQCEREGEGDSLQAVRAADSCPSGLTSARPPFLLFGATVYGHMFLPSRLS